MLLNAKGRVSPRSMLLAGKRAGKRGSEDPSVEESAAVLSHMLGWVPTCASTQPCLCAGLCACAAPDVLELGV